MSKIFGIVTLCLSLIFGAFAPHILFSKEAGVLRTSIAHLESSVRDLQEEVGRIEDESFYMRFLKPWFGGGPEAPRIELPSGEDDLQLSPWAYKILGSLGDLLKNHDKYSKMHNILKEASEQVKDHHRQVECLPFGRSWIDPEKISFLGSWIDLEKLPFVGTLIHPDVDDLHPEVVDLENLILDGVFLHLRTFILSLFVLGGGCWLCCKVTAKNTKHQDEGKGDRANKDVVDTKIFEKPLEQGQIKPLTLWQESKRLAQTITSHIFYIKMYWMLGILFIAHIIAPVYETLHHYGIVGTGELFFQHSNWIDWLLTAVQNIFQFLMNPLKVENSYLNAILQLIVMFSGFPPLAVILYPFLFALRRLGITKEKTQEEMELLLNKDREKELKNKEGGSMSGMTIKSGLTFIFKQIAFYIISYFFMDVWEKVKPPTIILEELNIPISQSVAE